jgi:hypothetical protein
MKKHLAQKLQLRKLTISTLTAHSLRGGTDAAGNTYTCDTACDVAPTFGNSCANICQASQFAAPDGVCLLSNPCDSISIAGPVTAAGTICLKCFRD